MRPMVARPASARRSATRSGPSRTHWSCSARSPSGTSSGWARRPRSPASARARPIDCWPRSRSPVWPSVCRSRAIAPASRRSAGRRACWPGSTSGRSPCRPCGGSARRPARRSTSPCCATPAWSTSRSSRARPPSGWPTCPARSCRSTRPPSARRSRSTSSRSSSRRSSARSRTSGSPRGPRRPGRRSMRRSAPTRTTGYGVDMEEVSIGVACVGAAVLDGGGVVGAMSVSAPRARMTDARIEEVGQRLVARRRRGLATAGASPGRDLEVRHQPEVIARVEARVVGCRPIEGERRPTTTRADPRTSR